MKTNHSHSPIVKQQNINWKKLLNVVALGAFIVVPVLGSVPTSDAQPKQGSNRDNNYGRDNNRGRDDDHRGRDNNRGRNDEDRDDNYRGRDNNRGRDDENRGRDNNNGRNNDRDWNNRNQYRTFTGTVVSVGNNKFDLRVNNVRLNVVPASRLPRGLSRGDTVRVHGVREGNKIVRANVTIINNR